MTSPSRSEVTRILQELQEDASAHPQDAERLLGLVYNEMRGMAANLFRRERVNHTLQPTALVHEAYLRLVKQDEVEWQGKAHFMGIASRVMRQILVDHARSHNAAKRGGGMERVTLDDSFQLAGNSDLEILDLHDALTRFAEMDPRGAQVVELRVFGGLTVKEAAEVLGVSPRTIDQDWSVAKLWLGRELGAG